MPNIYLYVKQHKNTKLKYFGKTVRNPYTYPGSGVRWKQHYRKHGKEHIETLQVWKFSNFKEAQQFAIKFSQENDIVNSSQWANLIIEQLEGGDTSHTMNYRDAMVRRPSRKGIPHTEETISKMRKPKISKENYKKLTPPSHVGRIYITNDINQLRIYPDQLLNYPGYRRGKLQISCTCGLLVDKQNLSRHQSRCLSQGKRIQRSS